MDETILIVSRDPAERDQLARAARQLGFRGWKLSSREGALAVLRYHAVALVLAETETSVQQDAAWLERLWGERPEATVVMLGPESPPSAALESLRLGAIDFIPRQRSPEELRRRLAEALVRRERWHLERHWRSVLEATLASREAELRGTYRQVLEALGAALDTRHPETQDHTRRVIDQSLRVARWMGLAEAKLMELEWGAALHDVGKIGIPDAVLLKPGALTSEEWVTMKSHCEIGYRMLAGITFLRSALPIVLHHHERFDGGGYPFGLSGDEIPFGARIFAVADAFDAMTSDRPYRAAMPTAAALEELLRGSGSQFDPAVVGAFMDVVGSGQVRAA